MQDRERESAKVAQEKLLLTLTCRPAAGMPTTSRRRWSSSGASIGQRLIDTRIIGGVEYTVLRMHRLLSVNLHQASQART